VFTMIADGGSTIGCAAKCTVGFGHTPADPADDESLVIGMTSAIVSENQSRKHHPGGGKGWEKG